MLERGSWVNRSSETRPETSTTCVLGRNIHSNRVCLWGFDGPESLAVQSGRFVETTGMRRWARYHTAQQCTNACTVLNTHVVHCNGEAPSPFQNNKGGHSWSDTGVSPCAGWRAEHSAGHGGVKTRYKQEAHKTDCCPAQQKRKLAQVDRPINLPFDCQSEQSPRFWAVKPGRQRDRRGGAKESPVGLSSTSPPLDKHSFEASTQRSPPPYLTRRHRPQPSLYTTYTPYNRPLSRK
jgi:hypothetical protein